MPVLGISRCRGPFLPPISLTKTREPTAEGGRRSRFRKLPCCGGGPHCGRCPCCDCSAGELETALHIAGHASPATPRGCDRRLRPAGPTRRAGRDRTGEGLIRLRLTRLRACSSWHGNQVSFPERMRCHLRHLRQFLELSRACICRLAAICQLSAPSWRLVAPVPQFVLEAEPVGLTTDLTQRSNGKGPAGGIACWREHVPDRFFQAVLLNRSFSCKPTHLCLIFAQKREARDPSSLQNLPPGHMPPRHLPPQHLPLCFWLPA